MSQPLAALQHPLVPQSAGLVHVSECCGALCWPSLQQDESRPLVSQGEAQDAWTVRCGFRGWGAVQEGQGPWDGVEGSRE